MAPDAPDSKTTNPMRRRARGNRTLVGALLIVVAGIVYLFWPRQPPVVLPTPGPEPSLLTAEAERALKPGDTFRECAGCPVMVVVPAGEFMMGSDDVGNAQPVHRVTIPKPFAISKFELTFDEWDTCTSRGGCSYRPGDQGWGRGRQPVVNVTWNDAQNYAAWASQQTGKTYRLLSEAEWEYAARAGSDKAYSWGDEVGTGNANCKGCGSKWDDKQPAPVGSFPPNAFGLHEMLGNVWEWVQDCSVDLGNDYRDAPSDGSPRTADDCKERVLRGGPYLHEPTSIKSASRAASGVDFRTVFIGFRIARTINP